jgi:hypothetical protein
LDNSDSTNYTQIDLIDSYYILNHTLPDGIYEFSVGCNNTAGNSNSSEAYTVTIDNTAPSVVLNNPSDNYATNSDTINFNWTVTDEFAETLICNLSINSSVNVSNILLSNNTAYNYSVAGIVEGLHDWSVTCIDNSSNSVTSSVRDLLFDTSIHRFFSAPENDTG